jgi:ankyrin repeat protein
MSELYCYSTPLHDAIREKNSKQVEILIKNGANILEKDDEDITPLELAKILNNTSIIALLEERKSKGVIQSHSQTIAK